MRENLFMNAKVIDRTAQCQTNFARRANFFQRLWQILRSNAVSQSVNHALAAGG